MRLAQPITLPNGADSNPLLSEIFEVSADVIYLFDRLEERYLSVNRRCLDILGYTPEQVLQMTPGDLERLIHPKDLARAKRHYGNLEHLDDDEVSETTYRLRHAHGDYRTLHCRQKVFSRTADGVTKCIIGVATDITSAARRQTEIRSLRAEVVRIRKSERERIAAQLHDTAVQDVVGAAFLLKALGGQEQALAEVRSCLSKALRSMLELGLE
jgi:PAS domain S-box-containing protein